MKHAVPLKALIDFERIHVPGKSQAELTFSVPLSNIRVVDNDGRSVLYPGQHHLIFSNGSGDNVTIPVSIGRT